MKMPYRVFLVILLLPLTASAEDRLAEYYRRAVPRAEQFAEQVPQQDFAVYTLFNNIGILTSANAGKESVMKLLRIAEEMQDKNLESPTFGNFRWYWSDTRVTDPNAVEFALARMLSISLDTPDSLSEEDRILLNQLLERSVNVCLNRNIHPDYTNIALYNAVHLILLGQVLDRPDVTQEGKLRLQKIVFNIWNHGIFEYNSPDYCFVNIDALQLGLRHVNDDQTKQMIHVLLELFWTDMSLHWYKPGMRLAGAQSRTSNFLHGTSVQTTRVFSFANLAPYDHGARYHGVLNSFRALYQPPTEIVELNGLYPRWMTRNWGPDPTQWAATYMFDDIALGTAGAKYEGRQNMVQTVDIADHLAGTPLSRSYFIADGCEDPYGTERSPTGSGGQQKALHLDALWFGSQRTVDSLGIALYPPQAIAESGVVNVQSHFVIRKPESIWIDGELDLQSPLPLWGRVRVGADGTQKNANCPHPSPLPEGEGTTRHQNCEIGNQPIVFRYKTSAIGIRAVWTRHQNGQPADVFLVNDGNEHEVYRLTVEHGKPIDPPKNEEMAGVAFWVRIGSHLESDEQFSAWREQFLSAKVHHLDVKQNDIDIAVAGQDGVVAVKRTDSIVATEPAAPLGILTLDGNDWGRPILEKIPAMAQFVKKRNESKPIVVHPSGTQWEVASGYAFFDEIIEPDGTAARINHDLAWQLQVEQPGNYFLWGRVQTLDEKHDSFFVELAKRLPDGSFMCRSMNADWHLGTRADWTWVRLPMPIHLDEGIWQLTLKPREYEGRIDQLFLTQSGSP